MVIGDTSCPVNESESSLVRPHPLGNAENNGQILIKPGPSPPQYANILTEDNDVCGYVLVGKAEFLFGCAGRTHLVF